MSAALERLRQLLQPGEAKRLVVFDFSLLVYPHLGARLTKEGVMQWLTVAWWRWRLAQALARNPVVRTSDRIEVVVMALAVALSLAAMPVALAIGTAVHDEHARAYTAEQHDRHRVVATATEDSASSPSGAVAVVQTRSQVSDVENAGAFTWKSRVKDGSSIDIWVDRHGRQVGPPTQSGRRVPTPLSLRWGSGCRFPQRLRCSSLSFDGV